VRGRFRPLRWPPTMNFVNYKTLTTTLLHQPTNSKTWLTYSAHLPRISTYPPCTPCNLLNATNLWLGLGFHSGPITCCCVPAPAASITTRTPKGTWSCEVPTQHMVNCYSNTWSSDSIGQVQPFPCKLLSLCFCLVHASRCVSGAAADYGEDSSLFSSALPAGHHTAKVSTPA
jgi:hypothetical protein